LEATKCLVSRGRAEAVALGDHERLDVLAGDLSHYHRHAVLLEVVVEAADRPRVDEYSLLGLAFGK
jgi:hypothetical protein